MSFLDDLIGQQVSTTTVFTYTTPLKVIDDLIYVQKSNLIMTVSSQQFNATYDVKVDSDFFEQTEPQRLISINQAYDYAWRTEVKHDIFTDIDDRII